MLPAIINKETIRVVLRIGLLILLCSLRVFAFIEVAPFAKVFAKQKSAPHKINVDDVLEINIVGIKRLFCMTPYQTAVTKTIHNPTFSRIQETLEVVLKENVETPRNIKCSRYKFSSYLSLQ